MGKVDDGGKAFPIVDEIGIAEGGMTLLDYFASKSQDIDEELSKEYLLKAYPEVGELPNWQKDPEGSAKWWNRLNAIHKYKKAQAMIAEKRRLEKEGA